jgi:hypothetical protein
MTCSVCQQEKGPEDFYKRRKFPLCKECGRQAKASGQTIRIKASVPEDVKSIKDFIDYSSWRLGCAARDFKANAIILKYSGYELIDLARTVEWCAKQGKHPSEPWKVLFWVDEFLESKTVSVPLSDPIERQLQDIYTTADPEVRKRIRAVAGKPDKRAALSLLRELTQ